MDMETMSLEELQKKFDEVVVDYDILLCANLYCSEKIKVTSGKRYQEYRELKKVTEERLLKVERTLDHLRFNINVEESKLLPPSEPHTAERPFEGLCIPGN